MHMKKKEIKYLFFVLVTYFSLFLFHKFMFINIQTVDLVESRSEGGAGLFLLALAILLAVCLILLFYNIIKITVLKKSFLILILYFFYFSMRILIDIKDIEKLKAYTIATTGGMILFYGMGALIGLLIRIIYKTNHKTETSLLLSCKMFFFVVYAVYNCYSLINVFISQVENISYSHFVLKGDVSYQRTGNFLLMNSIVLSLLYIESYVSVSNLKYNKIFYKLLSFFVYLFYMLGIVIISQLVGSNTAFACSIGILLLLCLFHILFFITKKKRFFYQNKFSVNKIFFLGKNAHLVRKSILFSILILSVGLVFIVLCLNIDLTKLRFFNYGKDGIVSSSFTTRFELLHNFVIHFSISPFWGNMAADALTTGDGSYVHSFLLSMLSHVGILGTVLFLFFISQSLTEFFYISTPSITLFILVVYKFLLFFGFFAAACMTSFLNWTVLWFLFGILFYPVKILRL